MMKDRFFKGISLLLFQRKVNELYFCRIPIIILSTFVEVTVTRMAALFKTRGLLSEITFGCCKYFQQNRLYITSYWSWGNTRFCFSFMRSLVRIPLMIPFTCST